MKPNSNASYDVAIIGAGVNGAGIARDAAMRGLKVLILDKGDMCNATSAISSRLIHGGLRYLEYGEIPLVYESLHERRWLRRIAAHLVKPLRINIPVYKGARRSRWLIRLGMIAYDVLSWNKSLPRHDMLAAEEARGALPGIQSEGLVATARYFDAQVTFVERLVLDNLLEAISAGADVKTYCRVVKMDLASGCVEGLTYEDQDGRQHSVPVAAVVNAAGPWVDDVLSTTGESVRRQIGGTKGSHIVVRRFEGAPSEALYVEAASDGRPFFIIPWNDLLLIGTTDIRYDGNLNQIRASEPEIEYLISETNRVFPNTRLTRDDICYAYAGVRPLPFRKDGPESAITRRHIIKIDKKLARNLVSIIGGKVTTYRNLAEQCVDKLGKVLDRPLPPCRTHDEMLPGASNLEQARDNLRASGLLHESAIERLISIYGGHASEIAKRVATDSELLGPGVLRAEIAHTVQCEFPKTLIDVVFRRTMLGFDANQGREYYDAIADVCAELLSWSAEGREQQLLALIAYADSLAVS